MRPAQSLKPASYVCPFCDGMLHATSEHALVAPEGDVSKRRHAHLDCVAAERRAGTALDRRRVARAGARPSYDAKFAIASTANTGAATA